MEVKISLSDGFEIFEKSGSGKDNFVSMCITDKELENCTMLENASGWIKTVSKTTDINMMRLSYIAAHGLICAYRQDFHSMIIGSLRGTVKNVDIRVADNRGKVLMNAFVDALYKISFVPENSMFDYMFFSNEKLNSGGGLNYGYICMDVFMNTADVSYKIKSIQQSQEDIGIEMLINEKDASKIGIKLSYLKNLIRDLKHSLNNTKINARVERLKDIVGFGIIDGNEIFLLLENNSGDILSNDDDISDVDLSNIILLDEEKFRNNYKDYISNNVLDYESVSDISTDDGTVNGLEIVKLSDMDLVIFELMMICVDLCFVKDCKPFIVLDIGRYFDYATQDVDRELAVILPLFNEFITNIISTEENMNKGNFGTVIYLGVKADSKTEVALKQYNK